MFSIIETAATAVLLILLMIFILHVIRGDAADWFVSKFRIDILDDDEDMPATTPNKITPNAGVPA